MRVRFSNRNILQFAFAFTTTKTVSGTSSSFVSKAATTTAFFQNIQPPSKVRTIATNTSKMVKARTALDEMGSKGEFKRKDAVWRNWISSEPGAKFPPEKDRYHLYVARACGWAHRTMVTRALKGLEDAISVTITHPMFVRTRPNDENDTHAGWMFGDPDGEPLSNSIGLGGPFPACYPKNEPDDQVEGAKFLRDIYEAAGDTEGKYTVPVLWDKKLKTIVSNESSEIIRMLSSEFNEFAKNPELDIYPESMRKDIDEINDWVYSSLNNGVYRCGFAQSQEAYDKAIAELTEGFDRVDEILKKQRYIAGDTFTEADIRLFTTLVRFDEVYNVYFKCNTRMCSQSPSILNYMREIYQMPGVAETCDMEQIKVHYYASHPNLNRWSIVPRGPDTIKLLEEPHNRAEM